MTNKKQGTGLGLMVVERIIREHGAELTLNSVPGEGTIFKIKFPRFGQRIHLLPSPSDCYDEGEC